jgi:hypothetical protein
MTPNATDTIDSSTSTAININHITATTTAAVVPG